MDRYDCVTDNDGEDQDSYGTMESSTDGAYVKYADVERILEVLEGVATEMERWLMSDGVGSENVADPAISDWKARLTAARHRS